MDRETTARSMSLRQHHTLWDDLPWVVARVTAVLIAAGLPVELQVRVLFAAVGLYLVSLAGFGLRLGRAIRDDRRADRSRPARLHDPLG